MKRIYIAGPVTGLPKLNRPAFEAAAETLRAVSHEPVIPHDHVPAHACWKSAMKICLPELLGCDYVALLPGWEDSRGAKIEKKLAEASGIPVYGIGYWGGDI